MAHLHWNEQTITDFSNANITALYHEGYVFTRLGKGVMQQTRSLRVDLGKFELTSENRRILRKTQNLKPITYNLPIKNYDWRIAKLAKDFYDTKFGPGTMSANKVKELLTDEKKSNFNLLLTYSINDPISYAICYENNDLLHYAYPFYELRIMNYELSNLGMGMMLKSIIHAQEAEKKYCYLGSATRPADTYKLQFAGLEWWDGKSWETDIQLLKNNLYAGQI